MNKFSFFSIKQAAGRAGVSPDQITRVLAELEKYASPPADHRARHPRKRWKCSLPQAFSKPEEPDVELFYEAYVGGSPMREFEVLAFWGTFDPSRCALFSKRPGTTHDTYLKLLLEVLITTKSRRAPDAGLTRPPLGDTLQLRELVRRVAERGAQTSNWFDGSVEVSVEFHLNFPGTILLRLATLQQRFRCLHLENPEGWGDLTAEVALISHPTLVSITRPVKS